MSTSHPSITLHAPTPTTISSLKRLNTLLLPISYPSRFYNEILGSRQLTRLTRLAFYQPGTTTTTTTAAEGAEGVVAAPTHPTCVGAIRCRLDGAAVYIMTLCTLSPYRRLGVGSMLLESVLGPGVAEVYAHVWEANAEALDWYAKRGFVVEQGVVQGYYWKLKPGGARVVRRAVRPSEVLGREPVTVDPEEEEGGEGRDEREGGGDGGERDGEEERRVVVVDCPM